MIWLIGNKGMLGTEIAMMLEEQKLPFVGSDRNVDITDRAALLEFSRGKGIDWIINCSAYTAVDKAEEERDLAYLINETGVAHIGETASEIGAKVIHVSTDYVFDGTRNEPLLESDQVAPQSVYGASKLAGEEALLKACPQSFIVRTAWLYGKHGNNFVYTMLKLMNSRDGLKVVDDQRGSPTWAMNLAHLLVTMVKSDSSSYGVYHFSGEGDISWYDFAKEIYRLGKEQGLVESECVIDSCGSDQYPTAAKRPSYSLLSKEKVKSTFHIDIKDWKSNLSDFFQRGIEL